MWSKEVTDDDVIIYDETYKYQNGTNCPTRSRKTINNICDPCGTGDKQTCSIACMDNLFYERINLYYPQIEIGLCAILECGRSSGRTYA